MNKIIENLKFKAKYPMYFDSYLISRLTINSCTRLQILSSIKNQIFSQTTNCQCDCDLNLFLNVIESNFMLLVTKYKISLNRKKRFNPDQNTLQNI